MHQVGYSGGYGKHGVGFMVSTLSSITLEGLCLIVALVRVRVREESASEAHTQASAHMHERRITCIGTHESASHPCRYT